MNRDIRPTLRFVGDAGDAPKPHPPAEMREIIHAWIREDLPLSAKMIMRPHHVEALIARLAAFPAAAFPALAQPDGKLREAAQTALIQLDKAADQFAFYADEHAKKGMREGETKGAINHHWALACAKAASPLRELLAQPNPAEGE